MNIVGDGFISTFILFRATASLITIFIITYVYLSLPIFLAVILFIGGLGLLMTGCCSLSNGVPAIVREREAAQNRWLFFVTQCLGVLPAAQVTKSHHILLERLEVLLKDWSGKRRKLVKANTKTQLWPVFIEDVLCKVTFYNTVRAASISINLLEHNTWSRLTMLTPTVYAAEVFGWYYYQTCLLARFVYFLY